MAGCSGFVYGTNVAAQYLWSGTHRNVLVIGAESLSRVVNFEDRTSCILFGDGGGAVVLLLGLLLLTRRRRNRARGGETAAPAATTTLAAKEFIHPVAHLARQFIQVRRAIIATTTPRVLVTTARFIPSHTLLQFRPKKGAYPLRACT